MLSHSALARAFVIAIAVSLAWFQLLMEAGAGPSTRALTVEERVACQTAVEEVYWRHRIWPQENSSPKPPRAAVLSDEAIRDKVEDSLKKSAALEKWWQRPISAEQLQSEIERMAQQTRDPALLQELFTALEHDPYKVAECLARPALTERLIHNWYAYDDRFHGELKRRAENVLASTRRVSEMRAMGREYSETTWALRDDTAEPRDREGDPRRIELDAEDWGKGLESLARLFETRPESLPLHRLSRLHEDAGRFTVSAILSRNADHVTVATVTWPKRTFEDWWESERTTLEPEVIDERGDFTLAEVIQSGCPMDQWSPTTGPPPVGRYAHSAVWTGTEMIVWGGYDGANLNTGGRYNPATDSWIPTSLGANVPAARRNHGAVWTGTEMIVWGGSGGTCLNTGGRYNPVTDTWLQTSTGLDVAAGRSSHTVVWTGTEMILWGGACSGVVNTGGRYRPGNDTWLPVSTGTNTPSPRYEHTAVWTGSRMVIWGGVSGLTYFNDGGRYDPATNSWQTTSTGTNVPTGRSGHTAVWTGAEMIAWGGYGGAFLGTGGRYNAATDSWLATSTGVNAPAPRVYHTVVWTGTEMIVWGGNTTGGILANTGGRYNPSTNSWLTTSTGVNVPASRFRHTAVWTGNEMLVWGGMSGATDLDTGGRYSPSANTWLPTSTGAGARSGRAGHSVVWTGTEMIIWGGQEGAAWLNTGGRYTPATGTWSATSTGTNVPSARSGHSAVWTGTTMIVWGNTDAIVGTGGRYNPAADTWLTTSTGANAPARRYNHTAVWSGSEMIVWGGGFETELNTGGRYNPNTDTWLQTSTGENLPSPRGRHRAVWTGTEMIVWGGFTGAFNSVNTGGRYNPLSNTWLPTSVGANVPSARYGHTLVWTGTEMIVWGGSGTTFLGTGGRYDPDADTWVATSTAGQAPAARAFHSAVWTGDEMIVWGGQGQGAAYLNTGGRYLPSLNAWLTISTSGDAPSPRSNHTAIWTGTEMVVWGGAVGSVFLNTGGHYCPCQASTWHRENDGDGFGDDSITAWACAAPAGYIASAGDCDDTNGNVYPGAPQICDGLNNDCNHPLWPAVTGLNESDNDGDGFPECANDCAPLDPNTYPGAPEVNDGRDNQCPGDSGHAIVDELSGLSGFFKPTDNTEYSWRAQSGATLYQVARGTSPDFSTGCSTFTSSTPFVNDSTLPSSIGGRLYYLVRSLSPFPGSWGANSAGVERGFTCGNETQCTDGLDNDLDGHDDCEDPDCLSAPACQPQAFTFTDTFADDIVDTAVFDFFTGIAAAPTDYLFFEILKPTGSSSLCAARADFYRDSYLLYAPTGSSLPSGSWEKWFRLPATGGNWVIDNSSYLNRFGAGCFVNYSWCPEYGGFFGRFFQIVHPAHFNPSCETVDALVGCSNGTWQFTLKVGPSRLATCGF